MWILIGFVTFLGVVFYFGNKRIYLAWKGSECSSNEITYQYKLLSNKKGTTGLLVGVDGPSEYNFACKKPARLDSVLKLLGMSVEHQLTNKEFDQRVCVVCNDKNLQKVISENASIADAILEAFNSNKLFDCYVKEIRCKSGRLWVKFKAGTGFKEYYVTTLAETIIPILTTISNELSPVQIGNNREW